ncbi:MAG: UDP-N-acetylglucosamine 1-carboxyvinyltransferase [Candidatus Levybacteria bacterium RBG_16_35_6]|nr:MAG: UDP-N-acetylglucosamine 1-carboxyvinyltransferase [Candidatus Levybacteria bacterium RBG_16_35_6]
MEKLIIRGNKKLKGEISVSGSKNVALKALVAACMTDEEVLIENIPLITDFIIMAEIIEELGGEVSLQNHTISIRMREFKKERIQLDKAAEIRTSFMFLAPLLARIGKAIIPNPGGCRIGARQIDRTIDGLNKMGVSLSYNSQDGYFHAEVKKTLKGIKYKFAKNTHTGTETMILAAVLAKGRTILDNAAQEPEVDELIGLLNRMGAKIKRTNPRKIEITGVEKLHGARFKISPDRNEIVTFAVAGIITEGDIFIKNINRTGISEFLHKLDETGGGYEEKKDGIRFFYKGPLKPAEVMTSFYPGFMTDWQGPWATLMTKAKGVSIIHETIYENRFSYVKELRKMGAKIKFFDPDVKNPEKTYNFNVLDSKTKNHAIRITGPVNLHNAVLNVSDLRAGATLVIASLAAKGTSIIFGLEHLDRGYSEFYQRLKSLGADISRIKE